jgi:hypothetical protein
MFLECRKLQFPAVSNVNYKYCDIDHDRVSATDIKNKRIVWHRASRLLFNCWIFSFPASKFNIVCCWINISAPGDKSPHEPSLLVCCHKLQSFSRLIYFRNSVSPILSHHNMGKKKPIYTFPFCVKQLRRDREAELTSCCPLVMSKATWN